MKDQQQRIRKFYLKSPYNKHDKRFRFFKESNAYHNNMKYCDRIGFVTQDDVLFPHLTVKETLTYAALLRLPKTLTREQKEKRAIDVINELGLER